jgi:hypothetical protein
MEAVAIKANGGGTKKLTINNIQAIENIVLQ